MQFQTALTEAEKALDDLVINLEVSETSTEAVEGGVKGLESRASELEARSVEIEKSLGGIGNAQRRARAAT